MKNEKLWDKLSKDRKYICPFSDFRRSGYLQGRKFIYEDTLLNDLRPFSNKIVMDIGCGHGRISEFMSYWFKKVYAVDVSGKMLDKARKRLSFVKNIEFVKTDGRSVPQVPCHLFFSFATLQHMRKPEIEETFSSVRKMMGRGNIFKVQIRGLKCKQGQWYSGDWYSEKEALELADKTGFSVINYKGVGERYLWLWLQAK